MELLAPDAKLRRDTLAEEGKCINGPNHGPLVPGKKRCAWCVQVHRVGAEAAHYIAGEHPDNPQPPPGLRIQAWRR